MIHLYHGDGKGKTTAAMGLALRMLGHGENVFIVQFLKGKPTGEVRALLTLPGVTVLRGRPEGKFVFEMTPEEKEETAALHQRQLELAASAAEQGRASMLVLDEALDAVNTGTLDEAQLLEVIEACRNKAEVVLTGRNPSAEMLAAADYITFMRKDRHPFDEGCAAREGIEF